MTYGLQIRDGLGSQTARMLGVYAIAQTVGIHYVHSPFQCIGHIGGAPHYRNMRCDHLPPADMQRLKRISQHIYLPSTTAADVSTWDSVHIFRGNWVSLARAAAAAFASKRPTLIKLELVDEFISVCPDIFYHVDAWRPSRMPDTSVWLMWWPVCCNSTHSNLRDTQRHLEGILGRHPLSSMQHLARHQAA